MSTPHTKSNTKYLNFKFKPTTFITDARFSEKAEKIKRYDCKVLDFGL